MPHLPDLATCKKVGFIVPSSNTAVEPITQAIFRSLNANIICIFTRIQVKTVGADAKSTSQFATETMVAAARLLADAEPDAILWNGTSGMWVGGGLEAEEKLAQAMEDATGVACSTTTLATIEAFDTLGVSYISIAVPYDQPTTDKVVEFFSNSGRGWKIAEAFHLEDTPASNIEIAKTSYKDIRDVIAKCSSPTIVACTNWPAAPYAEDLEDELGIPLVDSIIVTAWKGLRMVGYHGGVSSWGKLMREC